MSFNGFTDEDFNVFTIDGLDERMSALKETIRPKLHTLGDHFAPTLSALTGDEMFPHVAKHARRTKNPPNDTWVAFGSSKRGYKKLPHFQIGLWETHLFVWYALIYESPIKQTYAHKLEENLDDVLQQIPAHFVWSGDHTKPEATPQGQLEEEGLQQLITRLKDVKKAEILCGIHIKREDAVQMSGDELSKKITDTFETLTPLYTLAQNVYE
ncbi:DUF1054 domain-containing protein [Bacillus tianshenii]|nr:DUF1054 domain-containing protein [Bacillus tianshenii]